MLARLSLLGLPGEASTHHYLTCLDGSTEPPNKVARKFEFSPLPPTSLYLRGGFG
jgi:hypothetical protein